MKSAPSRFLLKLGIILGGVLGVALAITLIQTARTGTGKVARLPDGSELKLLRIAFTNKYSYAHVSGPPILRAISPILPRFLTQRLNVGSGGSFGFGVDAGSSNLFAITRERWKTNAGSFLQRARVADDQGNTFDACWGAHTLGMPNEVIRGWQFRAFPRRSPRLTLQFIGRPDNQSDWTVTSFDIPNPAYDFYPEWTPEPWPRSKPAGTLAVTLKEFQSGDCIAQYGSAADEGSPRKTRLQFTFAENGQLSEDWRVQKVIISDATGNHWFPYLDLFGKNKLYWAEGGTVEFLGALWPGEKAWKLNVEVVRTKGFRPEELWENTITLPPAGSVSSLTNQLRKANVSVHLAAIGSPNAEHAGAFQWTCKWWGEEKHLVYSLGMALQGQVDGWRVIIVRAVDDQERPVKIMDHRSADYSTQAIFLKPVEMARSIRLTLTLQKSRFVDFLARPEFVDPGSAQTKAGKP